MQATVKKDENKQSEGKAKPCVFGKEVMQSCPVRALLEGDEKSPIDKYLNGPPIDHPGLAEIDNMAKIMKNAMGSLSSSFTILGAFCKACPHNKIYSNKKAWTGE